MDRRVVCGACARTLVTLSQVLYLMDTTVYLLVVLSNADGAVKSAMCTRDNLLQHLECLRRLQPPHLVEVRQNGTILQGAAPGGL